MTSTFFRIVVIPELPDLLVGDFTTIIRGELGLVFWVETGLELECKLTEIVVLIGVDFKGDSRLFEIFKCECSLSKCASLCDALTKTCKKYKINIFFQGIF